MAQMKSKRRRKSVQHVTIYPTGGLNYSAPAASIPDTDLIRAYNQIYDPVSNNPVTVPGIRCVTTTANALATGIDALYLYQKDTTTSYLVCKADNDYYYLDGSDTWQSIGVATDGTTKPAFLTINGKLLIADGSASGIRYWDGSTYGFITGSPSKPTALMEINGRVVSNSGDDLDRAFCTEAFSETVWSGGGAIQLRVGYGDGLEVNGFTVFNTMLVVSKRGEEGQRSMYYVDFSSATPTKSDLLQANTAAQSAACLTTAGGRILFFDDDGFKSFVPSDTAAPYLVDVVTGSKLNSIFKRTSARSGNEIVYVPLFGSVWILLKNSSDIFVWHPWGADGGSFTQVNFGTQINSMYPGDEKLYLAGENGQLYEMAATTNGFEVVDESVEPIQGIITTKEFTSTFGLILSKVQIQCDSRTETTGHIKVVDPYTGEANTIKSFTTTEPETLIFDATGLIFDADDIIGATRLLSEPVGTRTRNRGKSIQLQIHTTSGRMGVSEIRMLFVEVAR